MPRNSSGRPLDRPAGSRGVRQAAEAFWMPLSPQLTMLLDTPPPMTAHETAVVRRLRRGPRWGRPVQRLRERMAVRRRRRLLDQLAYGDVRNLAQLIIRLGL